MYGCRFTAAVAVAHEQQQQGCLQQRPCGFAAGAPGRLAAAAVSCGGAFMRCAVF
jgi:hypothetical protein